MKIKLISFTICILLFSISAACADIFSEPSWVYKGIGDRHYRNGEIGEAIFAYKKALRARINETENNEEKFEGYPEANLQLAKIYIAEELFYIAEKQLETAEKNKQLLEIPELELEILYTKAELFYKKGNRTEAEKKYNEIILKDVEGEKYFKKYDRESEYTLTENFLDNPEQKTKFSRAYLGIAEIKIDRKNFGAAIPYLKMALMHKYELKDTTDKLSKCYKYLNNQVMAEKAKAIYIKTK